MGKSTIIKSILNNLVNKNCTFGQVPRAEILENYGAIVITDSLDRLEEINTYPGLEDRCYFMRYDKEEENEIHNRNKIDFMDQLSEQYKYPIVLISTQKYFKMKDSDRSSLYKWKNGERKLKLIDEKPYIIQSNVIDEKYLSDITVFLESLVKGDDKEYLQNYWNQVKCGLDGLRNAYTEYDLNWICGADADILINKATDKKFFELLDIYATTKIYDDINRIKDINKQGCLFISSREKDRDGTRKFVLINNNVDKFDSDKCKTIIFDATALHDIHYDKKISEKFKRFSSDDSKDSDINLHHIITSTSQNNLKNNQKHIENISEYINTLSDDLFVATYGRKSGIYGKFIKLLKTKNISYFGNIKGKNDWQGFDCMAHIGLNRKANDVYLITYIALNKTDIKWNEIQDANIIARHISRLVESKKGLFVNSDEMNDIMTSDLAIDTIQNVMRIKCRHFSNKDKCQIYILCARYLYPVVNRIGDAIGANIISYEPDIFRKETTMDRKSIDGKEFTNPQILSKYIDTLPIGLELKMKDIITGSGLTRDQIKNASKKNSYIREWLDEHRGEKKGSYVV